MTTLVEVGQYINQADESDIDRIFTLCKERSRILRNQAALAVSVGADVELAGISPKYLNGLKGCVIRISGQRCDVRLTKDSTTSLRYSGRRYFIPVAVEEYEMAGVPLSCAKVLS